MSYSRYNKRDKIINSDEMYKDSFDKRDVNSITHYSTPKLNHLQPDKLYNISEFVHIWKSGDRLYKLAYEHYGDSELWWIIAWYNKKPTEAHFKIGDTVYIPNPLEKVLNIMGI